MREQGGGSSGREEAGAVPIVAWGSKHRREAWSRIFELTASALRMSAAPLRACEPLNPAMCATEAKYRKALEVFSPRFGVDVEREVCRVRDIAEGRKVREPVDTSDLRRIRLPNGEHFDIGAGLVARVLKRNPGARAFRLRVTRIRKALDS